MKKLFAIVFGILCLAGCDVHYYSVTVTNKSSKNVTFSYDDLSHTLAQNVSETYQVKAHTQPPKDINVSGAMSVSMTAVQSGNEYLFEDKPPMIVNVLNTLSFDVKLAEKGNCVEDDNGHPFIECPKQESAGAGKIYTKSPDFYLQGDDQYSVKFEYTISDEGKMFVTIR